MDLFIIAPYIKTAVLEKLLAGVSVKVIVVTSWDTRDLLSGSSELDLYLYCKKRGFTLYVNNDIHLKVYSGDFDDMIVTTANVSERGLFPDGNLECAVYVAQLKNADRIYFAQIIKNARHINDIIYQQLKNWYESQTKNIPVSTNIFDSIVRSREYDNFLISALPMTRDIETLEDAYLRINTGLPASGDHETRECVFHDLANYSVPTGLAVMEFREQLKRSFFSHPFIKKIDEIIDPEAFFGEVKAWVQKNCTDVPVPSRRELTGNIQVLLEWFVKLGDGRYAVDVPYSYSQRIRKMY